jgi:prevent-host-death family protein
VRIRREIVLSAQSGSGYDCDYISGHERVAMKETSIREAKSSLTRVLREVERGRPVRLTRRGKPIAVLLSERQYERLVAARQPDRDFFRFLSGWRREVIAKGLSFLSDEELAALRDRSPGREKTLGS